MIFKNEYHKEAWFVVLVYLTFGLSWIYFSDTVLNWLVRDPQIITRISIYKGFLFIVVTAILLFLLILRLTRRIRNYTMALSKSESHLQTLIHAIPDLIWLKDTNGVYLSCNSKFERFFGASESDIVGKRDYDFVDKELADFFLTHDKRAIQAGKPMSNEEWITFSDSGERVLLETIKTPMYDHEGELIGVLGIGRDITKRAKAEREREELQQQLTQAQKMESVGRLAGGIAHDFNNMLGVIIGHTELAMLKLDSDGPVYSMLSKIDQAANRSAKLTGQLLAFARKQPALPRLLDLNRTIEGMLDMLEKLIGEDIELVWVPGNNVGRVTVDPSQLDQILVNLCLNAKDAINDVGKVVVETNIVALNEISSSHDLSASPGKYVLLAVSDDGVGMDRETQSHLFEPFFTTKNIGSGTGLGLATVYGIVKQNNGFIHVYSEVGQGATFKVYLPVLEDTIEKRGELLEIEQTDIVPRGNETVLLVEDEIMVLDLVVSMLNNLGYRVMAAATPDEAIEMAQNYSGSIDLLITDVIMPKMNGLELVDQLRESCPDLHYLFMSGYTANIIAHHGVLDEGVTFLQKPFDIDELGRKVREALH